MHQQCMNDVKIWNYSSCHGTDKARFRWMQVLCSILWVAQQPQLKQYHVGREGRGEQSKALQCSQFSEHSALCYWGRQNIDQRHLWTFTALGGFKSDCLTGAHTTWSSESDAVPSAGAPSLTPSPSVTCSGEPKAIPARNAPTQGHGLQILHCSTQTMCSYTASVCLPSLRKEIHLVLILLSNLEMRGHTNYL